jgi:hypothetical protein
MRRCSDEASGSLGYHPSRELSGPSIGAESAPLCNADNSNADNMNYVLTTGLTSRREHRMGTRSVGGEEKQLHQVQENGFEFLLGLFPGFLIRLF